MTMRQLDDLGDEDGDHVGGAFGAEGARGLVEGVERGFVAEGRQTVGEEVPDEHGGVGE
ncbi:hypothetical protein [Streptomyces sp. G-G2]|uniref:hypothetical protein n=1 Tax=Streptomyces sp. G-G2 TaxID=3046201 RepID=UPI0024BBBC85|nr:hypothetical protein [Streptomyces sp. G-G2]MDJ0386287.1 hypothetical protein [Streptomyces sp. G-G2]